MMRHGFVPRATQRSAVPLHHSFVTGVTGDKADLKAVAAGIAKARPFVEVSGVASHASPRRPR